MFAVFDESKFPIIIVKFNGTIDDPSEFNLFIDKWERIYSYEKDFMFIFDTSNMENIGIKYSLLVANFIKELKKKKRQYLKKSLIIIKNTFIQKLLDIIFIFQKPLSYVYITSDDIDVIKKSIDSLYNNDICDFINITNIIEPNDSNECYFDNIMNYIK